MSRFPRGSEWRIWDLHIHAPTTKLNDGYKTGSGEDPWDKFCDALENSKVMAFGITDYFSADSYFVFLEKFRQKFPDSKKQFFFNLELRLNESVNQATEEVNLHLIFNPDVGKEKVEKFLQKLEVIATGEDETPISCSELKTGSDFKSATVSRDGIKKAILETFGRKTIRQDHFLAFAAANNDGIRPERGKARKAIITDEIDKFCDGFIGGQQNVEWFLNTDRLEDEKITIARKPVISGSDCHSFEDIEQYLGKRYTKTEDEKDTVVKDICWIKSDPTYDGLRQILYEPESGERVYIGPVKPDIKNDYQIIKKISFLNAKDFPLEIEFNPNLSSIIGSRSSGKSALLTYVAHAIDPELTEVVKDGPADGFGWEMVDFTYQVEWANGKTNSDSPGKIVFVPQNQLFRLGENSEEITKKIEPVLFNKYPEFSLEFEKFRTSLTDCNERVRNNVEAWFDCSQLLEGQEEKLKHLGNKKSIEAEKKSCENEISTFQDKYALSESEIKIIQSINSKISSNTERVKRIEIELRKVKGSDEIAENQSLFKKVEMSLSPSVDNLPKELRIRIEEYLENQKSDILKGVNDIVTNYRAELVNEKVKLDKENEEINSTNSELIGKYQKHIEVENLLKKINDLNVKLSSIAESEKEKGEILGLMKQIEENISSVIGERKNLLKEIRSEIEKIDQDKIENIQFGIEVKIAPEKYYAVAERVNTKELSEHIDRVTHLLKLDFIRDNVSVFLADLYSGKQKINLGNEPMRVANDVLTLTESVMFTAEMEGDKIGGYMKTSMTAGKRALFALRLILAESDDEWPLLIDQPEDDLDSRSIYDEIVPFLKKKKKDRQILMVSHNANLVIGSDSEQVIVANRDGHDRQNKDGKQFNYFTGSIEFSKEKDEGAQDTLTSQGIREHSCEILDGGETAFEHRRNRYNIIKS